MLSKRAEKLLKWIDRQPKATKISEIEKKCKSFDRAALKMLYQGKLICYRFDENFDGWNYCQVTESGKAYLRDLKRKSRKQALELLTIGISIAALFGADAIAEVACKLWGIVRALLP